MIHFFLHAILAHDSFVDMHDLLKHDSFCLLIIIIIIYIYLFNFFLNTIHSNVILLWHEAFILTCEFSLLQVRSFHKMSFSCNWHTIDSFIHLFWVVIFFLMSFSFLCFQLFTWFLRMIRLHVIVSMIWLHMWFFHNFLHFPMWFFHTINL